ncbi:MAG: dehypoxanthine futalosine cyclase [Bacteroidetes bacterium CG2_30_32_10]|nr:MAG: dehypoxanthine futalosine cyclase [Bacteroidetes bacterium CG2_30_32_10]
MHIDKLLDKALNMEFLSVEESITIYNRLSTSDLMFIAYQIKKSIKPDATTTWIIDRNINITNICCSGCQFCNFYRSINSEEAYITTFEQYAEKIDELYRLGGRQLLLQGGLHPKLGLKFYVDLFKKLKNNYPDIKLHALGPPEIVHISKLENKSYKQILLNLKEAGLDSLPGAGAEILSDRVRGIISKNKCNTKEWLDVMREAHKLNITTSATMMFGHIETLKERFEHLVLLRNVQAEKPKDSKGFIAFIPWVFYAENTVLKNKHPEIKPIFGDEYIKMIAMSRIVLPNIENIQPSWLTVGKKVGQICLHAGANDFGSIMIEENVVSSAGANYHLNAKEIQKAIIDAGFKPQLRNQQYESIELS